MVDLVRYWMHRENGAPLMPITLPFQPVIIIGAGRSGTNILRDTLTGLPSFATWPCDEINPIWRQGNLHWPNDELPVQRLTATIQRRIRSAFVQIWKQQGSPEFVVEKTCANALRVPFVAAAVPEAKFIHIIRDGHDVVRSAQRRWQGKMEIPSLPYFVAKARYTPLQNLPHYGLNFVKNRVSLLAKGGHRLASWGPRFDDMDLIMDRPLDVICAHQWAACVTQATQALRHSPAASMALFYDDFVRAPDAGVAKITQFLGVQIGADTIARATRDVRRPSGNTAPQTGLSDEAVQIIRKTMSMMEA